MTPNQNSDVPAGWVGGYAASSPAFAYPDPDLTTLPMLKNMDNIPLLQRQQAVKWPEFSWETNPGHSESRCFQMFAQDISRLGYTNTGRVYSIICPQQGITVPNIGSLNVEVSVTGQRGWVDETNRTLAADMSVTGRIWFSPSCKGEAYQQVKAYFNKNSLPFPVDKAKAIQITTHKSGSPDQPIFPVKKGESTLFKAPAFARHEEEAWAVGNLEVQIGAIVPTNNDKVDKFNQNILDIFNLGVGNMLQKGNVLTWNVWFTAPELVSQQEWSQHAETWRKSIQADHGPTSGPKKFADGSIFDPVENNKVEIGLAALKLVSNLL